MRDFGLIAGQTLSQVAQWTQARGRLLDVATVILALLVAWLLRAAASRRRHCAAPADPARAQAPRDVLVDLLPAGAVTAVTGLGALVLTAFDLDASLARTVAVAATALLLVRIVLKGLARLSGVRAALSPASETILTWLVWPFTAMLLLGWLEPALLAIDGLAIEVGGSRFSLLDVLQACLTLLVLLAAAAYAGQVLERRLMDLQHLPVGVRVGVGKTIRLLLVLLAVLLALDVLGIDLGGLAVFGGALGVGIGFGLQRVASNFVSGFILLGDRSIRPGDVITIGDRFGVVRGLRARYVVVRDRDGVDTLIPNENIITSEVINWSYSDRSIRLKMPVQVSYQDDPRQALSLMIQAAAAHPRVEQSPEPVGRVISFGASGIDLELRFWIRDPEDGVNNVRSDIYLAIWDAFKAAGITIPYPQHDVHIRTKIVPPAIG